jgi:hypothetical protein
MQLMRSISGIRGIVGQTLTPQTVISLPFAGLHELIFDNHIGLIIYHNFEFLAKFICANYCHRGNIEKKINTPTAST